MKSEILWSEIYAVHSEDKILQDAIQCSHYTGLWYLLKHTAASSKACGNNRRMNLCLRCPGVYMGSISLKRLLKPHPEDNTEMVRTFGHKRGVQSASSSPRIFRPASPTLRAWHKAKLGGKVPSWTWPFHANSHEETYWVGKGRGYRDQGVAAYCWHHSVRKPPFLSILMLYTKQLLEKMKVLTAFRGG